MSSGLGVCDLDIVAALAGCIVESVKEPCRGQALAGAAGGVNRDGFGGLERMLLPRSRGLPLGACRAIFSKVHWIPFSLQPLHGGSPKATRTEHLLPCPFRRHSAQDLHSRSFDSFVKVIGRPRSSMRTRPGTGAGAARHLRLALTHCLQMGALFSVSST